MFKYDRIVNVLWLLIIQHFTIKLLCMMCYCVVSTLIWLRK
jgi:hypothetical protein